MRADWYERKGNLLHNVWKTRCWKHLSNKQKLATRNRQLATRKLSYISVDSSIRKLRLEVGLKSGPSYNHTFPLSLF